MTIKQWLLKKLYPVIIWSQQKSSKAKELQNKQMIYPVIPFHSLSITLNNGKELPLDNLRGKKILIVNTASNCGYTGQYAELQKLYQHSKDELEIIGFPANDFKEQETGSDKDIASFCSVNYGVTFPLAKKTSVVKGQDQNTVFHWLSDKTKNGWMEQQPEWNFSKYLINEKGILTHYFPPAVSPLSNEVLNAINE